MYRFCRICGKLPGDLALSVIKVKVRGPQDKRDHLLEKYRGDKWRVKKGAENPKYADAYTTMLADMLSAQCSNSSKS